jgi:hypothetical protein
MRGSVTRLNKKLGCGFILGEAGCEACFRSEEPWNTRNTLDTSACGRRGSKSFRISGANPKVRVELVLGPPISLASTRAGSSALTSGVAN